jgi:DNA invertase Pin-like site-specific DNA recombinase
MAWRFAPRTTESHRAALGSATWNETGTSVPDGRLSGSEWAQSYPEGFKYPIRLGWIVPTDYAPTYEAILQIARAAYKLMPPPDEDVVIVDESPLKDLSQCVIYTRLSREDDRSHSPQTQLYLCEQCAKFQKWKVLKVFSQDAEQPISGKAFEARPGWDALTTYLKRMPDKERAKTVVLVKSFDRFSRNLREGLEVEETFREVLKVRLRSADNVYLAPETPDGKMTFVQMLNFAEYERSIIVKRTRDGLATARREGKHLGNFPRHFEQDPEGKIIPTSKAMSAVQLRSEGYSYTQIAELVPGVTRQEAFSICKWLSNQIARGALDD